jgi:hypothetical protein
MVGVWDKKYDIKVHVVGYHKLSHAQKIIDGNLFSFYSLYKTFFRRV